HVLVARDRGVDLKVVVGLTTLPGLTLVVHSDRLGAVTHPADLRGLRIGITSPGSATDQLLTLILKRSGLSRADVEIVPIGSDGMPDALASGDVDAAMALDPWTDEVLDSGLAFVLVDLTTEADTSDWLGVPYAFVGALTSQQTIVERPEIVQRVVNTLVHTCAVLNHSNPAAVTALLPREVVGDDASAYAASVGHYWAALSKDCKVSVEGVSNFLTAQAESGAIPGASEADPSSLFDMTFVNRVHVNLRG
ncbi:MAG: NitT/TauT family transport system substrate-binding protein, partial [Chloroflexi bacterium]|nr:NitT/TauT family transport system substrate-binding protein [Chloroflexota bacterium]